MLEMDIVGWIVVGFIAGAISGALLGGKTARGCLPNVVVGILGGIIGGWLAQQMGFDQAQGFIAAVVVAVFGALVVRLVLNAAQPVGLTRRGPAAPVRLPSSHDRLRRPRPRPTDRPGARRPYSPGLEGVIAGETSLELRRRRARPAALPRLPDRRPRRARHVPGGRRTCCGPATGIRRTACRRRPSRTRC